MYHNAPGNVNYFFCARLHLTKAAHRRLPGGQDGAVIYNKAESRLARRGGGRRGEVRLPACPHDWCLPGGESGAVIYNKAESRPARSGGNCRRKSGSPLVRMTGACRADRMGPPFIIKPKADRPDALAKAPEVPCRQSLRRARHLSEEQPHPQPYQQQVDRIEAVIAVFDGTVVRPLTAAVEPDER